MEKQIESRFCVFLLISCIQMNILKEKVHFFSGFIYLYNFLLQSFIFKKMVFVGLNENLKKNQKKSKKVSYLNLFANCCCFGSGFYLKSDEFWTECGVKTRRFFKGKVFNINFFLMHYSNHK